MKSMFPTWSQENYDFYNGNLRRTTNTECSKLFKILHSKLRLAHHHAALMMEMSMLLFEYMKLFHHFILKILLLILSK